MDLPQGCGLATPWILLLVFGIEWTVLKSASYLVGLFQQIQGGYKICICSEKRL